MIGAVVLLNGVLGFVQENKAESAVAALRLMTAANSTANGAVQRASPDKDRRRVPA